MSVSIKVAIKVRPLIKREKEKNLPKQWTVQGNYITSTDQEMRKRGDEVRNQNAESDGAIQVSLLNLEDIAVSEKAGQTGATEERFKEGLHINLTLSAFILVIGQLNESQDTQNHVNFRDSNLTTRKVTLRQKNRR